METIDKDQLTKRLEALAWKRTKSFCYSCYKEVTSSHCPTCLSDDFARLLPGEGVDFGIDWALEVLVGVHVQPVDVEEMFEQFISDCYPSTVEIGWIKVDTITAIKTLDPVSWTLAQNDWIDQELEEKNLYTFDSGETYYASSDIEAFLDETEGNGES